MVVVYVLTFPMNKVYESRIERFLTFWTHPSRPGLLRLLLLQFLKVIFYWMIAEVSSAAQLAWECPENCNNGKLLSIHQHKQQHVPLMNFTFFLFKIATTGEKEIRSRRLLHTHWIHKKVPLKERHCANQELMHHRFHLPLRSLFWQEQAMHQILEC